MYIGKVNLNMKIGNKKYRVSFYTCPKVFLKKSVQKYIENRRKCRIKTLLIARHRKTVLKSKIGQFFAKKKSFSKFRKFRKILHLARFGEFFGMKYFLCQVSFYTKGSIQG